MLSRTADNLYWLSRYVERADFVARILEAAHRLASLPTSYGGGETNEWDSALASAGDPEVFKPHYGGVTAATVCDFLAFSPHNPSSIRSCIEAPARTPARSAPRSPPRCGTRSTAPGSNCVNTAARTSARVRPLPRLGEGRLADLRRLGLPHDAAQRRLLVHAPRDRDRAGRQHRPHPRREVPDPPAENETVGGSLDYFQWTTILREVSAFNAYHWVYRESIKPLLVADLLILNRQMPRSLLNCCDDVAHNLDRLATIYSRRGPAQRMATASVGRLAGLRIEQIFQSGLHEFITRFISENARISTVIAEQYLL